MKKLSLIKSLLKALPYIFVCMLGIQALAQESDIAGKSEQVNKLFEGTIHAAAPGASVLVIHQGKIVHKEGYGLANIEKELENSPETIFRLGSITKQFTSMAILLLHEKQLLQIDDPIEKYFPGTLNGEKITIRHLLTHTSGILESLDSELEFAPGARLSYSNTGYNLLGKLIEKVSGISYDSYLQENVFESLGMVHTGYEHVDTKIENCAVGYEISEDGSYKNMADSDVSGAYAAGALYSTVGDMYLWDQALYSEKLITKATLNQAFSPAELNDGSKTSYGFGWMLNQWRGLKEVSHGGDITGFNSYIARFPDEQFTVIVLSNVEMNPPGPLAHAGTLAHNISEIYLSDRLGTGIEHTAIQLDSRILENYIGQYKLVNAPEEMIAQTGEVFTILLRDDQLFLKSNLGEAEIYAEAKNQFFVLDNTTIKFTKDNEEVTGLVLDIMGLGVRMVQAEKIE